MALRSLWSPRTVTPALELKLHDGSWLALAFELGTGMLWASGRSEYRNWEWTRFGRSQPFTRPIWYTHPRVPARVEACTELVW